MVDNYTADIKAFIVSNFLFGQDRPLAEDQSLLESGVVDSTGMLELVSFLEETYGITIADNELVPQNLDSLRNLNALVARKRAAA